MDKNKLIAETKQRIDEINRKLKEIQDGLNGQHNDPLRTVEESTLKDLHTLRDELQAQYVRLSSSSEKMGQRDYDQMEKNIYNSLQSFNDAFTNAGSIFTRRFKRPE
ncbi:hypothetical protein SAMN06265379_101901 [Saccharicrinis carchari]|uniref:t-SNARE coiled-coil homology domain-containing protein n=1 Tax=Saccharicrinis carchari TaxID=1168039 RepID=A0A521BEC5_SACCC|nr:hypothetical protein [Saccharicrinis carchari]SMO45468.1 hypothetical protein SAMN06265379_101901 [Saccharicrinis carchari]